MTGVPVTDALLIGLGPVALWMVFRARPRPRPLSHAEALVLGALRVAPAQTVTHLQDCTGLTDQQLAVTLERLQDRLRRTDDRVTLR